MPRTLWIHIGTHKTGTSSLQLAFANNRNLLLEAGLCYPTAGCGDHPNGLRFPQHKLIVRELTGIAESADGQNGLDAALAEIAASSARAGCISAEAFSTLTHRPDALLRLRDRVTAAGFTPRIIAYLRPQADYLESLYAELLRLRLTDDFDTFVAQALHAGEVVRHEQGDSRTYVIDYMKLLASFAAVFGKDSIVVRAFHGDRTTAWIIEDFLHALDVTVDAQFAIPPRVNDRMSADAAAAILSANRAGAVGVPKPPPASTPGAAFAALRLRHVIAIAARSIGSNARLWSIYGVRIAPISAARLRAVMRL